MTIEKLGKDGVSYLWKKIKSQGYQTAADVENAMTAKGYQTADEVKTAINEALASYGNGDTHSF